MSDSKQPPKPRTTNPAQHGLTSLDDILKKQFAHLTKGRHTASSAVQQKWTEIIGPSLAQCTRVLYVKSEVLHIAVTQSTWLSELSFMKGKILSQIRMALPKTTIIDIKFQIKPE